MTNAMENKTPTSKAILTSLIFSSKKMRELLEMPTVSELELFDSGINQLYNYTIGYTANFYSKEHLFKLFCNVITDDEELPPNVIEWTMKYLGSVEYLKESDNELLENLKVQIEELRRKNTKEEQERQLAIIKNEEKTAEMRRSIAYNAFNCCSYSSYSNITSLITYAQNHGRSLLNFYIDIFTYGYITGKRAERARRKKNSN